MAGKLELSSKRRQKERKISTVTKTESVCLFFGCFHLQILILSETLLLCILSVKSAINKWKSLFQTHEFNKQCNMTKTNTTTTYSMRQNTLFSINKCIFFNYFYSSMLADYHLNHTTLSLFLSFGNLGPIC